MIKTNLSIQNVDHNNLILKYNSNSLLETSNFSKFDQVKINDITHHESEFENHSDDQVSTRMFEDRGVESSEEYYKVLNEKGQRLLE